MAGLDHHAAGAPREAEDPREIARRNRYALSLFSVYLVLYVAFVLLSAFAPSTMALTFLFEINLGVLAGLALIAIAFIMAVLYDWLCRPRAANGKDAGGVAA